MIVCEKCFEMKLALFLCCVSLAVVVTATDEVAENCTRGPFNFDDDNTWNTTNTGWQRKDCSYISSDHCMTASFRESGYSESSYFLESPTLCAQDNGTYKLSFRFFVSVGGLMFWRTSCYLAVHLRSQDTQRLLWRSSGPTFWHFWRLYPPLRFRPCSSRFKLIFEATEQREGDWWWNEAEVSFDDVKYTLVHSRSPRNGTCDWIPDDDPSDDDDNPTRMSTWAVIAIIVSLAVVTVILAILLLAAVLCGRKRKKQHGINNEKSTPSADYRTFTHYVPQQGRQSGMSDYENMDVSDGLLTTQLLPSGGNEPYNRLHATGGATRMEEDTSHVPHYDHVEGSGTYNNLHQQDRTRELQRKSMATNYSHI